MRHKGVRVLKRSDGHNERLRTIIENGVIKPLREYEPTKYQCYYY